MERPWHKQYVEGTPAEIDIPGGPLWASLDNAIKEFPDNVALYYEGLNITYRELGELVDRAANGFSKLGVKKGDTVAIMLNNCPQFVITYFGALKCGATVTPVNPLAKPKELRVYLQDTQASTIVVLNFFYGVVEAVRQESNLKNVIVTAGWDMMSKIKQILAPRLVYRKEMKEVPPLREGDLLWNNFMADTIPEAPTVSVDPSKDIAVYQFTGGTTGIPKAAMLTHDNLKANCAQCAAWMESIAERGKEIFVGALPLQHIFGQTVSMNLPISWGSKIILVPNARDIKHLLELIHKERPTFFPIVATLAISIYSHPDVAKYDLTSLKLSIAGAMALPAEVTRRYEEKTDSIIIEGYGLSEASPVTHANPLDKEKRKIGAIGLPFPSTDCKIVDLEDKNKELPIGEIGELAVKGPQVMQGYHNRPDETADVLSKDGWLFTGDIAKMDENGWTYIVDRKKDLINASGYKVWPNEVEEVLFEHPSVLEAAVIGIPDETRGETVKAYVVLEPGKTATVDEIRTFCKEKMSVYKVPTHIEFVDALPKSQVGKVLRRELRESTG
ncbi:MAG: long-chain fatty acid--CoA ligase [Candidatus Thorarchaeota archaeon]|nr:MAG: long-chain fatty acid--CoA ligase [Candidatus Thorarchaeota archaeon]RLI58867.1 MAG: long-chain fatty acid--CoA ligase [Candidatus Thorarchaeota archaeon]